MARISSREYESAKYSILYYLSPKARELIEKYESDILKNLPDIDKHEQKIIDEAESRAKGFMTNWRVAYSIKWALMELMNRGEIKPEDVTTCFDTTEQLFRYMKENIEGAKNEALAAYTIKNYGLKAHSKSLIEEHILPLIVSFVGIYLLLKKWKG